MNNHKKQETVICCVKNCQKEISKEKAIFVDGKYYKFATYNRSKLVEVKKLGAALRIELQNSQFRLQIIAKSNNSGELLAPVRGNMNRRIKESIDSRVLVNLNDKTGKEIFSGESGHAGLEIIDGIFDYV